jgi:hypothetical protein
MEETMEATNLAGRVEKRAKELGLSLSRVDQLAGLTSGFTRDLIVGRKGEPRLTNIQRLAAALGCSTDYLVHGREERDGMQNQTVHAVGFCERDAWRRRPREETRWDSGILPDIRHSSDDQIAWEVRDGHATGLGIEKGAFVICLSAAAMKRLGIEARVGDVAVVAVSNGELEETFITRLDGEAPHEKREVVGLPLMSVKRLMVE